MNTELRIKIILRKISLHMIQRLNITNPVKRNLYTFKLYKCAGFPLKYAKITRQRDALFKRTLDFFQTGGGPPPPSVWTYSGQYFLKAISPIKNNHNYETGPKNEAKFYLKKYSKCLKILPQNFRIGGRAPPPLGKSPK